MLLNVGLRAIEATAKKGGGRYSWCATTKTRWKRFCKFCESILIFEIDKISDEVVIAYADTCSVLATATAQNYISSVNSVMKLLNKYWISVSPKGLVGRSRSSVRKKPVSFSYSDIKLAIAELETRGEIELAAVVYLAANFGLRRREGALLDIATVIKEVKKNGCFDVTRGTKGGRGRYVERLIPCNNSKLEVLEKINMSIKGRRSLIPDGDNLKIFNQKISNVCIPLLKKYGVERLHELRVFYACERYKQITGCVAPCNKKTEDLLIHSEVDHDAREIISRELGHSRIQIVSTYVGRKTRIGKINE